MRVCAVLALVLAVLVPAMSSARMCACFSRVSRACGLRGAAGTRALLCAGSIGRACESGLFTPAQLEYMRASKASCDARDVVWHRAVTKAVARVETTQQAEQAWCCAEMPGIPETDFEANNEIMHALEEGRPQTRKGRRSKRRGGH